VPLIARRQDFAGSSHLSSLRVLLSSTYTPLHVYFLTFFSANRSYPTSSPGMDGVYTCRHALTIPTLNKYSLLAHLPPLPLARPKLRPNRLPRIPSSVLKSQPLFRQFGPINPYCSQKW
jgi:hypothetical protein